MSLKELQAVYQYPDEIPLPEWDALPLADKIRVIPDMEGFNKSEDTYIEAANKLKAVGWPDQEIYEFLDNLFHAAASEFGS